jgi:hypothetical protein
MCREKMLRPMLLPLSTHDRDKPSFYLASAPAYHAGCYWYESRRFRRNPRAGYALKPQSWAANNQCQAMSRTRDAIFDMERVPIDLEEMRPHMRHIGFV